MTRFLIATMRSYLFYGVLAISLMLIVSFQLRHKEFNSIDGAPNIIATYHALLTATALDESSAGHHWYLPTVSLGKEIDKNIPWGATVKTKTGDYIYTSFYSPGFVAPHLWFKTLQIAPSEINLVRFNFMLGCISALALFFLLTDLLIHNGFSRLTASASATIGCFIGVFSREALLSHGVTYWSQSLYQPILIGSLFFYLKYLTANSERLKKTHAAALILFAFSGPLIEWTGYVFNAGLVILLWMNSKQSPCSRTMAIKILAATALAGAVTLTHLALAVGLSPAIDALLGRFVARGTSAGSLAGLSSGYGQSYGLFLIVVIALGITILINYKQSSSAHRRTTLLILIASTTPLIENILMLQHATVFSFDRLKLIPLAALIIALAFASYKNIGRITLIIFIIASSVQNYIVYRSDISAFSKWGEINKENKILALNTTRDINPNCTIFTSSIGVRGYANLLFHHGIYEYVTTDDSLKLLHFRKGCALVHLDGFFAFPDLPAYTRATITKDTGETRIVESQKNLSVSQKQ